MNIRSNRYNDPALGEAFNNIASIFAPPSAQDMAGYATANAKKQEAEQLSWLFNNASDPTASARAALTGVQSYGNTPTGFNYGVDTQAATARRGQDIDANTTLQTNMNDNRFGLAEQFMTPLNPGQVQPGLPEGIAGAFNVPALPRTEGAPKPMSETEVKGAERLSLRGSGDLTDDLLLQSIMGEQTPVKIVGENGPVYSTPGAAAMSNAPAYVDTGSQAAPDVQNYRAPDGTAGTAVYRDGEGWVDTQTGAAIPQGSLTMKSNATGTADEALGTKSNVTLGQRTVALADYADSRAQSYQKFLAANPGVAGLPGVLTGFAQDLGAGVRELAAAYGDKAVSVEAVTGLTDQITGGGKYKPEIREALNRAAELAYLQAQLGDPGGEVNVREWERLYSQFIGNIGGNAAVAGPLRAFREQVGARRIYGNNLINGNQSAYPGATPPPNDAGAIPTVSSPEEAASLPSGTRFKTPDGRVKVVP